MQSNTKAFDFATAKGWLTANERNLLHNAASVVKRSGVMLNIGVEYGASLVCLRAGNATAQLIGIDLDNSKNVAHVKAKLITGDSGTAAEAWRKPLDLIFIDGDHSYEGVKRDMVFCDHLVKGGSVLFHDCYAWGKPPKTPHEICPDVTHAVDDWLKEHSDQYAEQPPVDSVRWFKKL